MTKKTAYQLRIKSPINNRIYKIPVKGKVQAHKNTGIIELNLQQIYTTKTIEEVIVSHPAAQYKQIVASDQDTRWLEEGKFQVYRTTKEMSFIGKSDNYQYWRIPAGIKVLARRTIENMYIVKSIDGQIISATRRGEIGVTAEEFLNSSVILEDAAFDIGTEEENGTRVQTVQEILNEVNAEINQTYIDSLQGLEGNISIDNASGGDDVEAFTNNHDEILSFSFEDDFVDPFL